MGRGGGWAQDASAAQLKAIRNSVQRNGPFGRDRARTRSDEDAKVCDMLLEGISCMTGNGGGTGALRRLADANRDTDLHFRTTPLAGGPIPVLCGAPNRSATTPAARSDRMIQYVLACADVVSHYLNNDAVVCVDLGLISTAPTSRDLDYTASMARKFVSGG